MALEGWDRGPLLVVARSTGPLHQPWEEACPSLASVVAGGGQTPEGWPLVPVAFVPFLLSSLVPVEVSCPPSSPALMLRPGRDRPSPALWEGLSGSQTERRARREDQDRQVLGGTPRWEGHPAGRHTPLGGTPWGAWTEPGMVGAGPRVAWAGVGFGL